MDSIPKTEHIALLAVAHAVVLLNKLNNTILSDSDRIDIYAAKGLLESVIASNGYEIFDIRGGTNIRKLNPNQDEETEE